MSDRVTNVEVEDVLSSIRRLVSEDNRGPKKRSTRGKPLGPDESEQGNGRLMLTAALRVPEPKVEATDTVTESEKPESLLKKQSEQPRLDVSIDSLVTDDVPLDVYNHEFAAERLEDDDGHLVRHVPAPEATSSEAAARQQVDATKVDGEVVEAIQTSTGLPDEMTEGSAFETSSKFGGSIESVFDEPDHVYPDPAVEDDGMSVSEARDEALTEEEATSSDPDANVAAPDVKAAALGAKIAALETAIGKISDTWEPDDAGESDYAGTQPDVMVWEDENPDSEPVSRPVLAPVMRMPKDPETEETLEEASADDADRSDPQPTAQPFTTKRSNLSRSLRDVIEEPTEDTPKENVAAAEVEDDVSEETEQDTVPEALQEDAIAAARVSEDEHLIDEEALRDLVSDIVRSELQGALGERITRNVRKLVRREIHRALVAQELE